MRKQQLLVLFCILLVGLLFAAVPVYCLEVYDPAAGKVLHREQVRLGEEFSVVWIYSVSLREVQETYRADGVGRIPIVRMVFDEPGPNLPANPEGSTRWVIEDGQFTVVDYDLVLEEVPVRIGEVISDHTLALRDRRVPLKEIHRPGGFVTLRVAQRRMWELVTGRLKYD